MSVRFLAVFVIGVFLTVTAWFMFRGCSHQPVPESPSVEAPLIPVATIESPLVSTPTFPSEPIGDKKVKPQVKEAIPKKNPLPAPVLAPPVVELHKELIPQNIEIVRVYYGESIGGPGSSIQFDINGSGFNEEFEKMIKVESGHPLISIQELSLLTPNQIHGTLVVDKKTPTVVAFPRVLINNKVVFQATEPFAIIRQGEVLNVVFTEMGESGRTGRFRVFTNLTPEMMKDFSVRASTPVIQIADLTPLFPYIVDGGIFIGPAAGGDYGLQIQLKEKVLWNRDGIIRVVRPNVGQSGLVQRIQVLDEFHRPGDKVIFAIQGSGFRPEDAGLLSSKVNNLEIISSSFVYLAPGRMELSFFIPKTATPGYYGISIYQGSELLMGLERIFTVVENNWMRGLKLQPALTPGSQSNVILVGRDMDKDFVSQIKTDVDEAELSVGSFKWIGPDEAVAPISAGSNVKPGDYLLHLTREGIPLLPQFGSIIQVGKKSQSN